jgi:hypothetical protein
MQKITGPIDNFQEESGWKEGPRRDGLVRTVIVSSSSSSLPSSSSRRHPVHTPLHRKKRKRQTLPTFEK